MFDKIVNQRLKMRREELKELFPKYNRRYLISKIITVLCGIIPLTLFITVPITKRIRRKLNLIKYEMYLIGNGITPPSVLTAAYQDQEAMTSLMLCN